MVFLLMYTSRHVLHVHVRGKSNPVRRVTLLAQDKTVRVRYSPLGTYYARANCVILRHQANILSDPEAKINAQKLYSMRYMNMYLSTYFILCNTTININV